jgi:hypothetical protein
VAPVVAGEYARVALQQPFPSKHVKIQRTMGGAAPFCCRRRWTAPGSCRCAPFARSAA